LSELEKYFGQNSARAYLDYTQSAIILINPQGCLLEWNHAFDRLKSDLPSAACIQDFLIEADQKVFFYEMLTKQEPYQAYLQFHNEGEEINFRCLLTPLPDGNKLLCAEPIQRSRDAELSFLTDELARTRRSLKIKKVELESVLVQADEVSHTDALTFLSNRRRIIADLQREVSSCDRYRKPLTIFMADIDHFKRINDTYGHAAGDQALRALSGEMLTSIRQIDKLGRYGGDEFLFILPVTTRISASKIAERLLKIVRSLEINLDERHSIRVSISLGIAQYRIGKESWDELLKRADQALYQSKDHGRDCWTISNFK
jgi:diguanylate cyclase (GGDEF)-like protein